MSESCLSAEDVLRMERNLRGQIDALEAEKANLEKENFALKSEAKDCICKIERIEKLERIVVVAKDYFKRIGKPALGGKQQQWWGQEALAKISELEKSEVRELRTGYVWRKNWKTTAIMLPVYWTIDGLRLGCGEVPLKEIQEVEIREVTHE